jgi:RNA polymerase primary sigma factor
MPTLTAESSLRLYLDSIKGASLLSAEQERRLARRIREHSDPIAREQMVQANLRLVVKIAKEHRRSGVALGDLIAEGNLGLLRAAEDFDPDAGVRFSTYASWWIKQAIKRVLINAGQPIRIPVYLAKLITKWRKAGNRFEARHGRPPTLEEMAETMGITCKKAEIIRQGLAAVNAPTQIGSDESQAVAEMLADFTTEAPDQRMLDESFTPAMETVMSQLDERSRRILALRFGLDGRSENLRTYKEVGAIVGLTRERVRQIEKEALAQLRKSADGLL